MKKILFYAVLGAFTLSGFNVSLVEAKNTPPGLDKKQENMPPGQYKKLNKNHRVNTTPRVYISPNPNIILNSIPLNIFNPGTYYFTTKSSALTTLQSAQQKGRAATLNFLNNRWVVQIK